MPALCDKERCSRSLAQGLFLTMLTAPVLAILAIPGSLLFDLSGHTSEIAAWGIFDAVNLMYSGALRGAGDTKFVVWVSGLLAWLFWIPGVIYLYAVQNAGIVTLWLFTNFYVAIFGLAFFLRFRTGKWNRIDLLGKREISL